MRPTTRLPPLLLAALALSARALAQGDPAAAPSVEVTRTALEKWTETRRLISQARSDWRTDKESLEQRIAMLRRQIDTLKQRVVDIEKNIGDAERERSQLQAENSALAAVSATLAERVTGLEQQTTELLARLPDPVRERVKPISQQFPGADEQAQKRLSVAARFGNVLGVLGIVHKQNREVTLTSELRTLPGGTTAEVSCLYFGLGQAFYVDQKGAAAGTGRATEAGWQWQAANQAAPAIQRAIDIYQGKSEPAFVPLPIEIQ
jgi:hypothetical protein